MVRVAMAARYDDEYNYNGDYNKEFFGRIGLHVTEHSKRMEEGAALLRPWWVGSAGTLLYLRRR